jgi:hypothetical protein
MSSSDQACFGYQIRPSGDGWAWTTFDLAGAVTARGWAPNKALAAACVIRALARAGEEDGRAAA